MRLLLLVLCILVLSFSGLSSAVSGKSERFNVGVIIGTLLTGLSAEAEAAGLKEGDVVIEIDDKRLSGDADFINWRQNKTSKFLVMRQGQYEGIVLNVATSTLLSGQTVAVVSELFENARFPVGTIITRLGGKEFKSAEELLAISKTAYTGPTKVVVPNQTASPGINNSGCPAWQCCWPHSGRYCTGPDGICAYTDLQLTFCGLTSTWKCCTLYTV